MPFQPSYYVPEARRAYTFLAGPVGCLILHGFMGSPASSRPLAEYLNQRGISVHCPLLPGHGELPNKLYRVSRRSWIAEAEEAMDLLSRHCEEIFLMGHSMGTVLCAYLASQNAGVRGLIMLAPATRVPDRRIHFLRLIRHFVPWFYPLSRKSLTGLVHERLLEFDPTLDFDDPTVQARLPEMSRVPTSGIDEMRKVLDLGRKLWPNMTFPAIIFQGEKDIAVSPADTRELYRVLPTEEKKLHLFARAGHELMRPFEPVHEQVWSAAHEFIKERSGAQSESVRPAAVSSNG